MVYEDLEVFSFDEFEELEASGVEEVVARHRFVYYVEDGVEVFLGDDLPIVEVVL